MKKLYSSAKWKKYSLIRKKNELRRRKLGRKYGDPPSKNNKLAALFLQPKNPDKVAMFPVPENFSFINNTDELLHYLATAKRLISERNILYFDKSEIKIMTSDAIALLVAHLEDKRFHRFMPFKGNAPKNPTLTRLFVESGFYDYVKSQIPKHKTENYLLHNFSLKKVKPQIAKEACQIGIKHTFEEEIMFEPLYEILIECMSNTNNHAGKGKRALYDWWIYVYKNPKQKITHYSFIDLGVGIFDSLPVRNHMMSILRSVNVVSNIYILEKILQGEIRSRTDDPLRGKGLPQIFEHSKHKNIKKFKIISNNVYADLSNGFRKELRYNFNGTFLYWELHP